MEKQSILKTIKEIHSLKGQYFNGSTLDDDRDKAVYRWFAKDKYTAARHEILAMTAYAAKEGYSAEICCPGGENGAFYEVERMAIFKALNIGNSGGKKEIWNLEKVAQFLNMPLDVAEEEELPEADFVLPGGENLWLPASILAWMDEDVEHRLRFRLQGSDKE